MNKEFIEAIFGDYADNCHVTDFIYPPDDIPEGQNLAAWKGDYFSRYVFGEGTNQYFTISTFAPDERGVARRRKALYLRTHCIVLDDVKEKLSHEAALQLPQPSWVLETSAGSEQWGYILEEPCTDMSMVDNLNDGLIRSELAPSGKDPGQKGVTRYVRLPDGWNNKKSKGLFKCQLTKWQPWLRCTMEDLAKPFGVDLHAPRREQRLDGAGDVDDHPLLQIPDLVHIKEQRSKGRFDVTCPWVHEHTGADDSGAAIFTNVDGSLGFKCHHGACEGRTGRDLINYIDGELPGWSTDLTRWQLSRAMGAVQPPAVASEPVEGGAAQPPEGGDPLVEALDAIRREVPGKRRNEMAAAFLKAVDGMSPMDRDYYRTELRDAMGWTKRELEQLLKELKAEWYQKAVPDFFGETVFVAGLNQFYDVAKDIFYTPDAFQNTYAHIDPEARKSALTGGLVLKVDAVDYAPGMPEVFTEGDKRYINTYKESGEKGRRGEVSPWLRHFDVLGWREERDHLINWMAFTLQHPEHKINHMILLGGFEGSGKDWLLTPLVRGMGRNSRTIHGDDLLRSFNDYVMGAKHLHVNEVELADHKDAKSVVAKLKPLVCAPPARLGVNQKGIKHIDVRNICNVSMTTNDRTPLPFGDSRRLFAVWSDFTGCDERGEKLPEWRDKWVELWEWMDNGGSDAVIDYLLNYDVSQFNPGAAPPKTEYFHAIAASSLSPLAQSLKALIAKGIGAYKGETISTEEACADLKAGAAFNADVVCVDTKFVTPSRVLAALHELKLVQKGGRFVIKAAEEELKPCGS